MRLSKYNLRTKDGRTHTFRWAVFSFEDYKEIFRWVESLPPNGFEYFTTNDGRKGIFVKWDYKERQFANTSFYTFEEIAKRVLRHWCYLRMKEEGMYSFRIETGIEMGQFGRKVQTLKGRWEWFAFQVADGSYIPYKRSTHRICTSKQIEEMAQSIASRRIGD